MFFSIAPTRLSNFDQSCELGPFIVNTDPGWQLYAKNSKIALYKGYSDSDPTKLLDDVVLNDNTEIPGNFCAIVYDADTQTIQVRHNKNRSFPLGYTGGTVSNLSSEHKIWADSRVTINADWTLNIEPVVLDLAMPDESLTLAQAGQRIGQQLIKNAENFYRNYQPNMKIFCSGGVDTLLLYTVLEKSGHDFELVKHLHYDYDHFVTKNCDALSQFWSYDRQIHHWVEPSYLASGSHGDEYLLRGPATIAMLTSWHNINILDIIDRNPTCYHYHYFKKYQAMWAESWNNRHLLQDQYPTKQELHQQILNILLNDHQYWHLGNTLTWTPFKNIDFVKTLLQCDIDELIPQFINAELTKSLINPELLNSLSQYKNINHTENLGNLYQYNSVVKKQHSKD